MNITKEAFNEWKEHPVTKEVFMQLEVNRANLLESMANGVTVGHTADVTHGLTNKMIGQVEGLNQLLNIDFAE